MTPRIPLRRCSKCLHYRRETCQLPDLDPCNFAPIGGKTYPRFRAQLEVYIFAALATIAATAIFFAFFFASHKTETNPTESDGIKIDGVSTVELLRNQRSGELSDFDKIIMTMSLEMFKKMQLFYNPNRNFEQAICYHNKSPRYLNKVREAYQLVKTYETIRAKLIEK